MLLKYTFLTCILFIALFLSCLAQEEDPFTIKKDAVRLSQRCFSITPDIKQKFGAVWFNEKADISKPLTLEFVIYLGDKDNSGADGIAFVMHTDPRDTLADGALGEEGGGLGFSRHTSQGNDKIFPSVSIEFDTWNNGNNSNDVSQDHTAVVYNGDVHTNFRPIVDYKGATVFNTPIKPASHFTDQNVENNECYQYTITWDPATAELKLFVDGIRVFTHTGNIINDIFGGNTQIRYGFTGSTGGSRNEQTICLLGGNTPPYALDDYATTAERKPVTVNITNNDLDPDGDVLAKSVMAHYPKKGTANIVDVNHVKYTPNTNFVGKDSLAYTTCDVNSIKCYAKCDTAWVYIDVTCVPFKIKAKQVSPNEVCDDQPPYTGTIAAEIDPAFASAFNLNNTDFFFRWYEGTTVKATADYDGAQINNLPEGTYTVIAENIHTGCLSAPEQVTIEKVISPVQAVIWQASPFTSCLIPDGELRAGVKVGTDTITTGYDFIWYDNDFVLTGDTIAVGGTASKLEAKKYAVLVRNQTTRCDIMISMEVFSNISYPTVSANVLQHITSCNVPDAGIAQANVGGDTTKHIFHWYKGNSVKASPDYQGATVKKLVSGNYSVTATDKKTGCTSSPAYITIKDETKSPVIAIKQVTQQQSCDPASPTGSLSAAINKHGSFVTSGYTFKWYKGLNDIEPAKPGYTEGADVQGLAAGQYRLVVIDNLTGCKSIKDTLIIEAQEQPIASLVTKSDVTVCSSTPNGSVSVAVGGNTSLYNFYWYQGSVSTPDTTLAFKKGASVNNLGVNTYTVFAAHKTLKCISDGLSLIITDATVKPMINTKVVAKQTACDPTLYDGILRATVNATSQGGGSADTVGYAFEWYFGKYGLTNAPGSQKKSGWATAKNLQAGNYTVIVTNNTTLCKNVAYIKLPKSIKKPNLDAIASIVHANRCQSPYGSSISVSADGRKTSANGYTFEWTQISTNTILPETTETLSNIPPGNYRVRVSNPLKCITSNPKVYTIEEKSPDVPVTFNTIPNTSCDPAAQPNGMISISGFPGTVSDYVFEWFENNISGPAVSSAKISADGTFVKNLREGTYALKITDKATACVKVKFTTLNYFQDAGPIVDTISTTALTNCIPGSYDGAAIFYIVSGDKLLPPDHASQRNFHFKLREIATGIIQQITITDTANFTGLNEGSYEMIIQDDFTKCESDPFKFSIRRNPQISISITPTPPTSCVSPNGSINIEVSSPTNQYPTGPGFTYEWNFIDLSSSSKTLVTGGADGSFTSERNNLETGYYEITVLDNATGCTQADTIFLPVSNPPALSVMDTTSSTGCSNADGDVAIKLKRLSSTFLNLSDYTVSVYKGKNPALISDNLLLSWNPIDNDDTTHIFSGLLAGNYTLVLKELAPPYCFASQELFKIDMTNPAATISVNENSDFTCNTSGTGQLTTLPKGGGDGDTDPTHFTYQWYAGSNTTGMAIATTQTASNLINGKYTVKITDISGPGNGCSYTKTFTLKKVYKNIKISNLAVSHQDQCLDNGQLTITEITEDGTSVAINDYTYRLLDKDRNPVTFPGTGNGIDKFTDLPKGSYYVVATNKLTGCTTEKDFEILDISKTPEVSIKQESPDFSCGTQYTTGVIKASAKDPVSGDIVNFDYQWFTGYLNTNPADALDASLIDPTDHSRAINLAAGYYTVLVTDTTGTGKNCATTWTIEVVKEDRIITLVLNSKPQDQCDPPTGKVWVAQSYEEDDLNGKVNTNPEDYTYILFDENMQEITSPTGSGKPSSHFEGLAEGKYFVQAINILSDSCMSVSFGIEITRNSTSPIVSIKELSKQYSYNTDPQTWTGKLEAIIKEDPANPLDSATLGFTYSYKWYKAADYPTGTVISNNQIVDKLDSGNYLLEVTNNITGCLNITTFLLSKVKLEPVLFISSIPRQTCVPDGIVVVDSILFGGVKDSINFYEYSLYYNDYPANLIKQIDNLYQNQVFDSLEIGNYYVRAFNQKLLVYTDVVQIQIDEVATYSIIALNAAESKPQTSCDSSKETNGVIAVDVFEADYTQDTYTYQWYWGQQVDAASMMIDSTDYKIKGLPSGYYTVEARNELTNCSSSQLFYVTELISVPTITASSAPNNHCDTDKLNGIVAAQVSNGESYYRYEWSRGSQVKSQPNYVGKVWEGLAPGEYTVIAIDLRNPTCIADPVTIAVEDETKTPEIFLNPVLPVSNCDLILANGELYAKVNNTTIGYSFRWYDEANNLISSGPSASNLTDQLYRVEVTNIHTGCKATAEYHLGTKYKEILLPNVQVISNMTLCNNPDGHAIASMHDNRSHYIFQWFDEQENEILVTGNSYEINGLSVGHYSVRAYDLRSGCISDPVDFDIQDESFSPSYTVSASPTTCDKDMGSIRLTPTDITEVDKVYWYTAKGTEILGTTFELLAAYEGEYRYEVVGNNGCTTIGYITVGADINVYNGVTPNGDGDNDFFEIGCIEKFPDNSVKIFNRAGALVFAATHYDNNQVRFEGKGNYGLYIGSKELPTGTYFYIIEKNDGSKPSTGYLELSK